MPGLRLLFRMAPFFVGVLAASVWLRRRQAARTVLAAGPRMWQITAAQAPDAPQSEAGQALKGPQVEPARRFEREPIDIVTVVDDLLLAGR